MKTKILLGLILFSIAGYLITACVKDDIYVGPPTIENVTRNPLAPGATDNVTTDYTKVVDSDGKSGDDYSFIQFRCEIDF